MPAPFLTGSEHREPKDLNLSLNPLAATLTENSPVSLIIATLPKTPYRKSFPCHTCKTPPGAFFLFPELPAAYLGAPHPACPQPRGAQPRAEILRFARRGARCAGDTGQKRRQATALRSGCG